MISVNFWRPRNWMRFWLLFRFLFALHTVDCAVAAHWRKECKCIRPRIRVLAAWIFPHSYFWKNYFLESPLCNCIWILFGKGGEGVTFLEPYRAFPFFLLLNFTFLKKGVCFSCLLCFVFLEMGQMQNSICGTFWLRPSFRLSAKFHQDPLDSSRLKY